MIDDGTGLLTIGELARVTGLTVRTIRYWSDEGALPPVARSAGGYRLYDAGSVARLELIRTLRELGLGLADVRRVLAGETTVAQVAAAHNAADHGHTTPAGASLWFSRRLVQLGAQARERGIAPDSPEAAEVLRELLGDADPATVLDRLRSHATNRVARYRELLAVVNGTGPEAAYREEFAWVVAALEVRAGG